MTRIDPGMPNVLIEFGREMFRRDDGRVTVGSNIVADQETWEQLVSGYRCAKCFHVQSQPFPEQCEFEFHTVTAELGVVDYRCPMRMRDEQMPYLMRGFGGEADYEPRDPYDVIDVEQEDWVKTQTGIVVPKGVDA